MHTYCDVTLIALANVAKNFFSNHQFLSSSHSVTYVTEDVL